MSETHNYKKEQGETLAIYNVWYDLDGNAKNLTGYTGNMFIYDRSETLLEAIALTVNASGEIEAEADTSAWPIGTYKYYMRMVAPSGFVSDLIAGTVTIK
jgi:hypothetical protein